MRTRLVLTGLALLAGVVTATARADGLPVLTEATERPELISADGAARYATVREARGTVVLRIERRGGRVFASGFLPGTFTIPVVAYDGSVSGLSADGSTLALVRRRTGFPRANTRFAILDAKTLRVRSVTTLPGDFSFDAISPDGSTLYFTEYLSQTDPTKYALRAYDAQGRRLLPEPILDRTEPDEEMGGNPLSRATSADGRWAYTLYDGAGMTPFVHALDTVAREAHCIDLDALTGRTDLGDFRLRLDESGLTIVKRGVALAVVDTETLRVVDPGAQGSSGHAGAPWVPIGVLVGIVFAAATLALARRRRRLAVTL